MVKELVESGLTPYEKARTMNPYAVRLPCDFRSEDERIAHGDLDVMIMPCELSTISGNSLWTPNHEGSLPSEVVVFGRLLEEKRQEPKVVVVYSPEFFHVSAAYEAIGQGRGRKGAASWIHAGLIEVVQSLGDPAILQLGLDQKVVPMTEKQTTELLEYLRQTKEE